MKFRINVTTEEGEVLCIKSIDTGEMNWNTQATRHCEANEIFDEMERYEKVHRIPKHIQDLADEISCMGPEAAVEAMRKKGLGSAEISEIIKACMLDSQGRMMGNYDQIARQIKSTLECSVRIGTRKDLGFKQFYTAEEAIEKLKE
ncbi:MAG: hypothetical protein ACYTBJ_00655 [Planctomycetota bacterium]|jgi:hypothetical protein